MYERELDRRRDELFGDTVAVERSAELLVERWGGRLTPAQMSGLYSAPERARTVAAEVARRAPDTALALGLAADVAAHIDKDVARAAALLDEISDAARAEQPEVFAGHLIAVGRAHDALDVLERQLLDEPQDTRAQSLRAAVLEGMHMQRVTHDMGACECEPGEDCCAAADRDVLARFADRGAVDRLQLQMRRFVATDARARVAVDRAVARWMQSADDLESVADPNALNTMAIEHAWIIGDDDSDSDEDTPLAWFAAASSTDEADKRCAERWGAHLEYGLWQVSDPRQTPGLWLTDLATGRVRYAEVPQYDELARWTVLLGALVAVDGVWRTTGAMLALRPGEGDELAEVAREMLYAIASAMGGDRIDPPPRSARPEPVGVLIAETEPAIAEVADLQSKALGAGLPQLLAVLAERRNAAPRLANTDGDPLCLIEATITVADVSATIEALRAHRDFEVDGGEVTWHGRELDAMERETSLAELRAQLHAQGETLELGEMSAPQRWVRGKLRPDHAGLHVEVNSRERLDRLVDALRDLDVEPSVGRTLVIDPSQDLPQLRASSMISFTGSAEASQAWLTHWPDQQLPALDGETPRRAACRASQRPYLEALLRELEHDADVVNGAGGEAPEIDDLRDTLGMPADPWE